jgi:hypothetical protein
MSTADLRDALQQIANDQIHAPTLGRNRRENPSDDFQLFASSSDLIPFEREHRQLQMKPGLLLEVFDTSCLFRRSRYQLLGFTVSPHSGKKKSAPSGRWQLAKGFVVTPEHRVAPRLASM